MFGKGPNDRKKVSGRLAAFHARAAPTTAVGGMTRRGLEFQIHKPDSDNTNKAPAVR